MPVSPDIAWQLAQEVVGFYSQAEQDMIEILAKRLARGIKNPNWVEKKRVEMAAMRREMQKLIDDLEKKSATGIETALTKAYEKGGLAAVAEIAQMTGAEAIESVAGARAIESLIKETITNAQATHLRILRSAYDAYQTVIGEGIQAELQAQLRSSISEGAARVLSGTETRIQASQRALNKIAQKGITGFVDKRGRGWNMQSYVDMAMRTACGNAAVQGHIDRLSANGFKLVIVSDAPMECPMCRPWEGKILSLTGPAVLTSSPKPAAPTSTPHSSDSWTPEEASELLAQQGGNEENFRLVYGQRGLDKLHQLQAPKASRTFTRATDGEGRAWFGARQDPWYESLSPAQREIIDHLDETHMRYNRQLRDVAKYSAREIDEMPDWAREMFLDPFDADEKAAIASLDELFASVPGLPDDLTVIRATNLAHYGQPVEVGGTIVDAGWADTSFWSDWLPPMDTYDAVLHIRLPKGSKVIHDKTNTWGNFGEVTLPRGSRIVITKIGTKGGYRHVWADFIPE